LRAFTSLAAAAILCCGALVFPGFGVGEHSEAPRTADVDLTVVHRIVSGDDNGFSRVTLDPEEIFGPWTLGFEAHWEASRLVSGESSDWELAEEILHRNADFLRRLDESLERRDFQFPDHQPGEWTKVILGWNRLTQILAIRAFLRAERQGTEAGVIDAMKLIRFGQRWQRAQGSLSNWFFASHAKALGLRCIQRLLETGGLPSQRLVALSEELGQYRADREGFTFATRLEYRFFLSRLDMVDRGELDPNILFLDGEAELSDRGELDVQRTKTTTAIVVRRIIDRVIRCEPTWGLELAPLDHVAPTEGNAFHEQRYTMLLETGAMEDTGLAATRTLLALRAHKQDHGRLAQSLDELVPDYLAEIPIDPFDGKPIRYAPSRKIVYSVGTDMVDRGGSDRERADRARWDNSQPTFWFEF
jgi:hypothetical protein